MGRRFVHCAETPAPTDVQHAQRDLAALPCGTLNQPADLSDIVLDMHGVPPLHQRVFGASVDGTQLERMRQSAQFVAERFENSPPYQNVLNLAKNFRA